MQQAVKRAADSYRPSVSEEVGHQEIDELMWSAVLQRIRFLPLLDMMKLVRLAQVVLVLVQHAAGFQQKNQILQVPTQSDWIPLAFRNEFPHGGRKRIQLKVLASLRSPQQENVQKSIGFMSENATNCRTWS